MFVGFLVAICVASRMGQFHEMFKDNSEPFGVVLAAGVMFVVGALDDLRDVSPPAKIAGQVFSASLLALFGVTMFYFRIPFNLFHLDVVVLSPDLAPLVTVLWVVLLAQAINLIDGLDGLAAGIVAIGGSSVVPLRRPALQARDSSTDRTSGRSSRSSRSACASASYRSTSIPRRSSWATRARCSSG